MPRSNLKGALPLGFAFVGKTVPQNVFGSSSPGDIGAKVKGVFILA